MNTLQLLQATGQTLGSMPAVRGMETRLQTDGQVPQFSRGGAI